MKIFFGTRPSNQKVIQHILYKKDLKFYYQDDCSKACSHGPVAAAGPRSSDSENIKSRRVTSGRGRCSGRLRAFIYSLVSETLNFPLYSFRIFITFCSVICKCKVSSISSIQKVCYIHNVYLIIHL